MAEDIKDQLARRIKDRVRLHLGPNALAQANEGHPVALNGGEADHVAGITLEVLIDLKLIVARPPVDDDLRHLADREIDLSRRRTAHFQKLYEGALDEVETARAEIARLREYTIHRRGCLFWVRRPCDCGLDTPKEATP